MRSQKYTPNHETQDEYDNNLNYLKKKVTHSTYYLEYLENNKANTTSTQRVLNPELKCGKLMLFLVTEIEAEE